MSQIQVYNTLDRKKEVFRPLHNKTVGLYTCGPTVYWYATIGNFRTFLFYDFLRRVLAYSGYKVKQVMNITDVGHLTSDADTGDDKIEKAAAASHQSAFNLARFYEKEFEKDRKLLNIKPPTKQVRATDHIKEQIALIKKLEEKGYTYTISDGVYFDTAKFKPYGKLSRQKLSEKKSGARVAVNDEKRSPSDFALWKFSPKDQKRQMEWPSPWGIGFPGWHIECSAMSVKYLGQPFDIHTGGVDHLAVHHEDEIAQSEAAAGKPLAKYWMHGEFLVIKEKDEQVKMSKSLGHEFTVAWLESLGIDPLAYRYLCLTTHYRKPLEFSLPALHAAETALTRLREAVTSLPSPAKAGAKQFEEKFLAAVNDDINLPKALAVAWDLARAANVDPRAKKRSLLHFDEVLGLDLKRKKIALTVPAKVKKLIHEREQARKNKDWAKADALRKEILTAGYTLEDTSAGPKIAKIK